MHLLPAGSRGRGGLHSSQLVCFQQIPFRLGSFCADVKQRPAVLRCAGPWSSAPHCRNRKHACAVIAAAQAPAKEHKGNAVAANGKGAKAKQGKSKPAAKVESKAKGVSKAAAAAQSLAEAALVRNDEAGTSMDGRGDAPTTSGSVTTASKPGTSNVSSGIKLEQISKTFKDQQVLKDISWDVKRGERVGLVGVNGAGKTTQLQIITGSIMPDTGEILKEKANMKIAYLTQEFDVVPSRTVREEFMSAFGEQVTVLQRQEQVQRDLEHCADDMDRMGELLDELSVLNSKAVDMDISLLDKKIDQMMPELGFSQEDNDRLVASYSGGWQMRMCLGKILLQDPDLLLLDEPTNHLDLDAIEWLEGYLRKQEVPMVIVSHDREFLDQLCTKIVETERGVSQTFRGNYTAYMKAKDERIAQQWAAWEKQQKEIARLEGLIDKLSAGAQSGRAAAAEKQLEKMRAEGLIEKPYVAKKRSFAFPSAEGMGQRVLSIHNLSHGYQDRMLFQGADLEVEQGDRVAIIGPNGCGKSTLLRLITGAEKPISGHIYMGEHGISVNYYEQNQSEALDTKLTVTDTMVNAAPLAKINDIKALLGRMMFSGKAMDKKAGVLSGGEKARLALAKFMMRPGTFLVLDEPTNHLDIPSKEMLEEAITQFNGSLIAVSHDRYFLRQIATRVITVEGGKLRDYGGNYDVFLAKNASEATVMADKEEKQKELAKKQIKAKSKMSKAEKAQQKKQKAQQFSGQSQKKVSKNQGRWN